MNNTAVFLILFLCSFLPSTYAHGTTNPFKKIVVGPDYTVDSRLTDLGNVRGKSFEISYSGTFVDQQDDDAKEESTYPLGAWEYHSGLKLIEAGKKKPLKVFLHVSENDLGKDRDARSHHNWVMANERMEEVLEKKGYNYRFIYSLSSKHCDSSVFKHTLAETLLWIWDEQD